MPSCSARRAGRPSSSRDVRTASYFVRIRAMWVFTVDSAMNSFWPTSSFESSSTHARSTSRSRNAQAGIGSSVRGGRARQSSVSSGLRRKLVSPGDEGTLTPGSDNSPDAEPCDPCSGITLRPSNIHSGEALHDASDGPCRRGRVARQRRPRGRSPTRCRPTRRQQTDADVAAAGRVESADDGATTRERAAASRSSASPESSRWTTSTPRAGPSARRSAIAGRSRPGATEPIPQLRLQQSARQAVGVVEVVAGGDAVEQRSRQAIEFAELSIPLDARRLGGGQLGAATPACVAEVEHELRAGTAG